MCGPEYVCVCLQMQVICICVCVSESACVCLCVSSLQLCTHAWPPLESACCCHRRLLSTVIQDKHTNEQTHTKNRERSFFSLSKRTNVSNLYFHSEASNNLFFFSPPLHSGCYFFGVSIKYMNKKRDSFAQLLLRVFLPEKTV